MPRLKPSRDVQPVTEFRANAAQFIEQVRTTGEPVILTQHGQSAAVLIDVAGYEAMSSTKLELSAMCSAPNVSCGRQGAVAGRRRQVTAGSVAR